MFPYNKKVMSQVYLAPRLQKVMKKPVYQTAKPVKLSVKNYNPQKTEYNGPENKWHDIGADLTSIANGPTATNAAYTLIPTILDIGRGDEGDARTGVKIQLKSIDLRMKCAIDANQDASISNIIASAHTFRVILFVDTNCNGGSPTHGQFFSEFPNSQGQLYDYNDLVQTGRFKVLMDKFVHVSPPYVATDTDGLVRSFGNHTFFKKHIKVDFPVRFSGAGGAITDIAKNNVGMWILSDCTTAALPHIKYSYRARVRFLDN